MSIELIVMRPGAPITLSEWTQVVQEDVDLRLRVEAYGAINPRTGAKISIKTGEADAEFQLDGQWVPFLRFRKSGQLSTRYVQEFDYPRNAVRLKIASVASRLGARIGIDTSDEFLSW
jgi:hypothetical protein